jgi:hypothetical protein
VQTALQQPASSHAEFACVSKQLPADAAPQVPLELLHDTLARSAQFPSHAVEQQNGSCPHTVAQHAALSQAGFECTAKHEPLTAAPQYPRQSEFASATQPASHGPLQQVGSRMQTVVQHSGLLHPLVAWMTKHEEGLFWQNCAVLGSDARSAQVVAASGAKKRNME